MATDPITWSGSIWFLLTVIFAVVTGWASLRWEAHEPIDEEEEEEKLQLRAELVRKKEELHLQQQSNTVQRMISSSTEYDPVKLRSQQARYASHVPIITAASGPRKSLDAGKVTSGAPGSVTTGLYSMKDVMASGSPQRGTTLSLLTDPSAENRWRVRATNLDQSDLQQPLMSSSAGDASGWSEARLSVYQASISGIPQGKLRPPPRPVVNDGDDLVKTQGATLQHLESSSRRLDSMRRLGGKSASPIRSAGPAAVTVSPLANNDATTGILPSAARSISPGSDSALVPFGSGDFSNNNDSIFSGSARRVSFDIPGGGQTPPVLPPFYGRNVSPTQGQNQRHQNSLRIRGDASLKQVPTAGVPSTLGAALSSFHKRWHTAEERSQAQPSIPPATPPHSRVDIEADVELSATDDDSQDGDTGSSSGEASPQPTYQRPLNWNLL